MWAQDGKLPIERSEDPRFFTAVELELLRVRHVSLGNHRDKFPNRE